MKVHFRNAIDGIPFVRNIEALNKFVYPKVHHSYLQSPLVANQGCQYQHLSEKFPITTIYNKQFSACTPNISVKFLFHLNESIYIVSFLNCPYNCEVTFPTCSLAFHSVKRYRK
jgi:hypothetical protein